MQRLDTTTHHQAKEQLSSQDFDQALTEYLVKKGLAYTGQTSVEDGPKVSEVIRNVQKSI